MNVGQVISRVRKIVGDTDVLQFTNADCYEWINDATKECASNNQLLQKTATSTVTQGDGDYVLPTDILKIHSVKYDGIKLRTTTMEEADKEFTLDTAQGTPVVAYVWANVLNLYPIPDNSTKSLQILYTRTPAEVTGDADAIDLPVMYHRRLVDYCLAMVAEQDDDQNRYQMKMEEFRSGVQSLKDDSEWEHDLYPSISVSTRDMGDGFYDSDW